MAEFNRMERGMRLARAGSVERIYPDGNEYYNVYGDTDTYTVVYDPRTGEYTCTCPDHENRRRYCKHIFAVIAVREDY
jgi:uncharacterized Zn finger protein